ncbi:Apolipoprotein N-acyltransferase [Candidatus Accumulibacter aalborgensis]|uniref:Apolipoprotein N-acyltransferase n=1 Tax=Candidatus Accumulibacter aalborgensis TaxID=1860102 RepID=A0A1A8XW17_9PROT|nr:apolipoprotein N-acyltransferase [Candidatus Accumulibacter aalborgensis]SBT08911.1 Apolipoprotein N-acyltransferase [Candidatus Accumulibacter aalborgensis]
MLGAAGVLAFAPVGWFAVNWLSLGGLFALLQAETGTARRVRRGALVAAAYGFGLFVAGVSWVYVSLSVFGGMPALLAGLATVLFCAVLALFPALAGALFVRLATPGWFRRALLFASLWTLAEWSRGWAFTGFPWLAAGYSQATPSPLAGYAPLLGVFGVSWSSALLGGLIFEVVRRWLSTEACSIRGWLRWCPALPLLATAVVLGGGALLHEVRWTQATGEPLSVALLQGNVAQDIKWRPERFFDSLRTYHRLAAENPARLTVLPETALPAFLDQVPGEYLDALQQLALRQNGDLLLGIAVADSRQYYNAALSLGAGGQQHYSKRHLVPFGEFVPAGFAWFMAMANIPMSDFTAGSPGQPPLRLAGQNVAVNICYEDAFGEEIIAALPAATLLVNLSNVAWFGDSLAPAQHLQIAQMRSLETGRMMLRATNTGMTAIVDIDGRVLSALPPFTRGALVGEVRGYSGATPYVRWGNWPVMVLAALLIAFTSSRQTMVPRA